MINKKSVGKRINFHRKLNGDSQATLAKKLGISSQAVSKWETGIALPDIEILLSISLMYKTSINEILEGNNIISKISNRKFVKDDIVYFIDKKERDYNIDWCKSIVQENWVKQNWDSGKINIESQKHIAKKIIIMEV